MKRYYEIFNARSMRTVKEEVGVDLGGWITLADLARCGDVRVYVKDNDSYEIFLSQELDSSSYGSSLASCDNVETLFMAKKGGKPEKIDAQQGGVSEVCGLSRHTSQGEKIGDVLYRAHIDNNTIVIVLSDGYRHIDGQESGDWYDFDVYLPPAAGWRQLLEKYHP